MIFVLIIVCMIAIFLAARLFMLKKEVKKTHKQLQSYNNQQTGKKINIALIDKNMEELGFEINKLIDLYVSENRKRVIFEKEQSDAIANISHDLRTPLTSVLGYIQMAQEEEVTPEEKDELLRIAKERAKRLEGLLKDFFELSIIESSEYPLKVERINLKQVTIDILMSFYDQFQENKLEPTIHMPDMEVFIISDISAVTRVVENLISNAIRYTEDNVVVSLEEDELHAKLIVKNDASTLTNQDARRMFDRFYMADQSRSSKSTGLGLSIVKSLMDRMDGTIKATLKDGVLFIICRWNKST